MSFLTSELIENHTRRFTPGALLARYYEISMTVLTLLRPRPKHGMRPLTSGIRFFRHRLKFVVQGVEHFGLSCLGSSAFFAGKLKRQRDRLIGRV